MSTNHVLPAKRKSVLLQRQQLKMAESAHAYVRGNTVQFYEWLRSDAVKGLLPVGPAVWICGDCHIGNLGPVADVDGKIEIQIRDLDQTVIGNPSHDLVRLALSLAMAARGSDLPGVTTALMLEEMIAGYCDGVRGRASAAKATKIAPIEKVMKEALRRTWKHLAEERIEDARPTIPLGKRFWPMTPEERDEVKELFQGETAREIARCIAGDEMEIKVRLLDAAYWVKGCSSLGRLRYAVLVGVGKKSDREYRLLDIKEATHAAAPCVDGMGEKKKRQAEKDGSGEMPGNDAERVVAGACHLSPHLGERMAAGMIGGRRVVIRELRPQDLKFELTGLSQAEAVATARMMASVVGRAHGRQMKQAERQAWIKELQTKNAHKLDAPRWLWSGVVDLVALHEAAYLEHCRRFAMGQSA